jgi:hypothetical protein
VPIQRNCYRVYDQGDQYHLQGLRFVHKGEEDGEMRFFHNVLSEDHLRTEYGRVETF